MKMFANENLFEPIIDYLRGLGHDVRSIRRGPNRKAESNDPGTS